MDGGRGYPGEGEGSEYQKFKTSKQFNEIFSNTVTRQFKHANSSNAHFSNTVMV